MSEVLIGIGLIIGLISLAWFVVKKIVYGLFYAATKAITNAKKKDVDCS